MITSLLPCCKNPLCACACVCECRVMLSPNLGSCLPVGYGSWVSRPCSARRLAGLMITETALELWPRVWPPTPRKFKEWVLDFKRLQQLYKYIWIQWIELESKYIVSVVRCLIIIISHIINVVDITFFIFLYSCNTAHTTGMLKLSHKGPLF